MPCSLAAVYKHIERCYLSSGAPVHVGALNPWKDVGSVSGVVEVLDDSGRSFRLSCNEESFCITRLTYANHFLPMSVFLEDVRSLPLMCIIVFK